MDFEKAQRERDEKLRRFLLVNLDGSKKFGPTGEAEGESLVKVSQTGLPPDEQFEDEKHAISLIRDLVNKGLATERFVNLRRGQTFKLRHMVLKITAMGTDLIAEAIDPVNGIYDDRIVEEK